MKNNIFKFSAIALAGISMAAGLSMNQPAQAATNFKRTKTTKISKKNFYSTSKTGKTYKFVGSTKKFHFKANHALKNYKHSTWVASAKTTVTKHGKKYNYYTVKNTKNGATGWVAASYLKSGKDFMMSSAKNTSKSNKVMKKSGKVYQLKGNNSHVSFTKGKALSTKMTYVASQKRTVYKSGKAYTYYYVTSKDNKTRGWVWSGFVKAGTYKAPTTSGTTTTTKPSTNNNNANTINNSSSATTGTEAFNESKVASDVVTLLNAERAKATFPNGAKAGALTLNSGLQQLAEARNPQLLTNFSHTDTSGNYLAVALAKQMGIYNTYVGEDLITAPIHKTNMETAKDIVDGFKATTDGHWDDLINPGMKTIGVGVVVSPSNKQNGYCNIQLGV